MNLTPALTELEEYSKNLQKQFLDKYLPTNPSHTPEDYKHDVSAFCVLFHAALEDYIENLAKTCANYSVDQWVRHREKTDCLISICINLCEKLSFPEDGEIKKSLDQLIREGIEKARSQYLQKIEQNHGASKKYLAKILAPIGLEISGDLNMENSLSKIVKYRGILAHKIEKTEIPAPEDTKNYASDCLLYCLQLTSAASAAIAK